MRRTPLGLAFVSEWGSCRHAAGVAAVFAMRARQVAADDLIAAQELLAFAEQQVRCWLVFAANVNCGHFWHFLIACWQHTVGAAVVHACL